jgi:hypothetical protein
VELRGLLSVFLFNFCDGKIWNGVGIEVHPHWRDLVFLWGAIQLPASGHVLRHAAYGEIYDQFFHASAIIILSQIMPKSQIIAIRESIMALN